MLLRKIPKWVHKIPDYATRNQLIEVAKGTKGKFDKPRYIVHSLEGFKSEESYRQAARRLKENGWECKVGVQRSDTITYDMKCSKSDFRFTEEAYKQDNSLFNRIAEAHHIEYGGWRVLKPKLKRNFLLLYAIRTAVVLPISILVFVVHYQLTNSADKNISNPSSAQNQSTTSAEYAAANPEVFNEKDFGISLTSPKEWRAVAIKIPCKSDGAILSEECETDLVWKNYSQRYPPTIRFIRYVGKIDDFTTQFEDVHKGENPTKETALVGGVRSVKYVTDLAGTTTETYVIPVNSKLLVIEGSTPRNSVPGLDYFDTFNKVVSSVKFTR